VLDERAAIDVVPPQIRVSGEQRWTRAAFLRWSARLEAALPVVDVPRTLWALADATAAGEATIPAQAAAPDGSMLASACADLRRALDKRVALHAYRAASDLASTVPKRMLAALDQPLPTGVRADRDEAFYLRATLHTHALAFDAALESTLRARALRLWIARALGDGGWRDDPAWEHPLALVEAYTRGFGL
jgi:hypothetical protein